MNHLSVRGMSKLVGKSIAAQATRRRDELARMKEVEELHKQKFREERERLSMELAHVEARAGKLRRQNETKEKQRVCFLIREIVLEAICNAGTKTFSVGTTSLGTLKPDQLALVELVARRRQSSSSAISVHDDLANNRVSLPSDISV